MLGSGLVVSDVSYILKFFRNFHTVFYDDCINLNSYWQYRWVSFSPCHVQHQMKLLIKLSVYTYFHLQSFGLGKSNQAQWTSIFLKTQLRNYLCLVDMEVPSDQVGISSRGKKGAHCRKFENNDQIEEKTVCFAESPCSSHSSFISGPALLPTSVAPPSLLTVTPLQQWCKTRGFRNSQELSLLAGKRSCGDGCGPR